jgi:hypothetical protein
MSSWEIPGQGKKRRAASRIWAAGLLAACSALAVSTAYAADMADPHAETVDPRPFVIVPTLGVQESVTNNVDLTSAARKTDFVTRIFAGAEVSLNEGRVEAHGTGQISYDQYARETELSGWSFLGYGTASYKLVPDLLSLDAEGTATNGNISTFGTSAVERSGVAGRVQLATYDVGPHLTTEVGDFADLNAIARFDQVFYTAADGSTVIDLPRDANIGQVVGRLDTGKRFPGYQLMTTGQYEKDNHGFQLYNIVESAFINLTPNLRVIGRGGYENVFQTKVTDISAGVWSAGLELTLNNRSKISVERGERYNHGAWAVNALVQISDRFYLRARYDETLQPDQVFISNSFIDFIDTTTQLPPPLMPGNFTVNGTLLDGTSLNKSAEAHLIYIWPTQSIDVSATWTDRLFLSSNTRDRVLVGHVTYRRQVREDLRAELELNYARTFESDLFGASRSYGLAGRLVYSANSTTEFGIGYAYANERQQFTGGEKLTENVGFVSIMKKF